MRTSDQRTKDFSMSVEESNSIGRRRFENSESKITGSAIQPDTNRLGAKKIRQVRLLIYFPRFCPNRPVVDRF